MLKNHNWGHIFCKLFLLSAEGIHCKRFHQNIFSRLKVIQTLNFAKIEHFCDYLEPV